MKKLLALLLAVAIVMTMSLPAFAEEVDEIVDDHSGSATATDKDPSAEIGVYGNYLERLDSEKILSVIVSWTDMYFEYAKSQQGTWNPEYHRYDNPVGEGKWLNDTATITIANHSNMAVTANLAFTANATDVTGTLSKPSVELATAVNTTVENAPKDNVTFTIGGSITEGTTNLGTINVTLSANESDTTGLNLSGKDVSEWQAEIEKYLAEIDPDKAGNVSLVTTLGVSTLTADHATPISSALGSYYSEGSGAEVALTITDATEIAETAFKGKCYHCNTVSLPKVTKIGKQAFMYCGKVGSFNLPECTSLGEEAFQFATSVTSFNLPKCTDLGNGALSYCSSLTEVVFGANITYTNGWFFGQTSDGSSDFYGTTTNTNNITVTIGANQGDYQNGSVYYTTKIGVPGEFIGNSFKEVKRAS